MEVTAQLLEGRQAKCPYCKTPAPSSNDLPFFEYRGEGSRDAMIGCKNCGYYAVAHTSPLPRHLAGHVCGKFEPQGGMQFDSYYCGCKGWD